MGLPLYLLISGDVLYGGLLCMGAAVALAGRFARVGAVLFWAGLVLAAASAVPLPGGSYALLALCGAAWLVTRRRGGRARVATTSVVVAGVLVTGGAALSGRGTLDLDLPRDRPVYVLGDSLSAGLGSSGVGQWPERLARERGLTVRSLARTGARLRDGVSQASAIAGGPSVVLVELGGNDLLGGASPQQFANDLRSLLRAIVGRERRVLMFELPLLPLQNGLGRLQRDVCRQYGVALVPRRVLAGAIALPGHTSDGLHLSERGHIWLAREAARMWR